MTRRTAIAALTGALVGAGAVIGLLSPTNGVPDTRHNYSPASIQAPTGSYVSDTDGLVRTGDQLPPAPDTVSGALTLPVLEAGTYLVVAPRPAPGGAHLPLASTITIGGGTSDQTLRPAVSPLAALAVIWVLLVTTAAVLGRRRRTNAILLTLAGLSITAYAVTGSTSTNAATWLSGGALAVAAMLAARAVTWELPSTPAATSTDTVAAPANATRTTGWIVTAGWATTSATAAVLALGPSYPLPYLAAATIGLLVAALPPGGTLRTRGKQLGLAGAGIVGALFLLPSFTTSVNSYTTPPSACANLEGEDSGECWAAAVASLSNTQPQDAVDQIARLESSYPQIPSGLVCRKAGNLLGTQFARHAADPHELFDDATSPCDFSFVHGIPMGALLSIPGGAAANIPSTQAAATASEVCRLPGPDYLPEQTYLVQCWHGVGQGIARQTNFDLPRVEAVCLTAPDMGARSNCAEGLYLELLDDARRGRESPSLQHAPTDAIRQACEQFAEDLVLGCWRYWVTIEKEAGTTPQRIAENLSSKCTGTPVRLNACWEGVGEAFTGDGPGADARTRLAAATQFCDTAPQEQSRIGCIQRSLNNVIPAKGSDSEILALCTEVPPDLRERTCAETFRFRDFLTGKGGN